MSRHVTNTVMQEKFKESEKLLNIIPIKLKLEIVHKTHQVVFLNILFFQNRSQKFTSKIVPELKPMNLNENDLLFQQGDQTLDIFFINSGKIKLVCDLNDLVCDDNLEAAIKEYESIVNKKDDERDQDEVNKQEFIDMSKAGIIPVSRFSDSTMFGDSDIFAIKASYKRLVDGRNLTAISADQSSLFVLNSKTIDII